MQSVADYGHIRSARARVRALRATTDGIVEVHVPLAVDRTHLGRVLFDLPRRVLPGLGEPGDRGEVHAFFDDEAPIREAAAAGLKFLKRRGSWLVFERGTPLIDDADSFPQEVRRVAAVIFDVERYRKGSPKEAVAELRARGRRQRARGPIGRARLRRAIGWVDALFGANCYRRTLAELALDAGAAGATLVFGLDVGRTGHVAFADTEDRTFDVVFELPP